MMIQNIKKKKWQHMIKVSNTLAKGGSPAHLRRNLAHSGATPAQLRSYFPLSSPLSGPTLALWVTSIVFHINHSFYLVFMCNLFCIINLCFFCWFWLASSSLCMVCCDWDDICKSDFDISYLLVVQSIWLGIVRYYATSESFNIYVYTLVQQ